MHLSYIVFTDAAKTQINVKEEIDSQFNIRSSSLTLPENYGNNNNPSSSTVCQKSLSQPIVLLTRPSISTIEWTFSNLIKSKYHVQYVITSVQEIVLISDFAIICCKFYTIKIC